MWEIEKNGFFHFSNAPTFPPSAYAHLQKLLNNLIEHLGEGIILDVFCKNSYVGVWK